MTEYRNGSHTVYDIKYHFVWITKYRYLEVTTIHDNMEGAHGIPVKAIED